jgi:hypothetical protein
VTSANRPTSQSRRRFAHVKIYLTVDQVLHLLCIGGRCNLFTVRSIQPMGNDMTQEILTARFAQALLAVTATVATVLLFQFA